MPSRSSVAPVYRSTFLASCLTLLQNDDQTPPLLTPSVRLFTGSLVPTPETPIATFTAAIATFSGYANVSPSVPAVVAAPSVNSLGLYLPALFAATVTDPFIPNTITGYYVFQGADWIMAERFAVGEEVEIAGPYQILDLAVYLGFPFRPIL